MWSLLFVPISVLGRPLQTEGLIKGKTKDEKTYYSGQITVSGLARRDTQDYQGYPDIRLGDRFCVFLSKNSEKKIPQVSPYKRSKLFCFSNAKSAIKLLGVPEKIPDGTCGYEFVTEIVVTGYIQQLSEDEIFDAARLVRVISRGELREVPCVPRKLEIDGYWY